MIFINNQGCTRSLQADCTYGVWIEISQAVICTVHWAEYESQALTMRFWGSIGTSPSFMARRRSRILFYEEVLPSLPLCGREIWLGTSECLSTCIPRADQVRSIRLQSLCNHCSACFGVDVSSASLSPVATLSLLW